MSHIRRTMGNYPIHLNEESALERLLSAEEEFLEYERLGGPQIMKQVVAVVFWCLPAFVKLFLVEMNLGMLRFSYFFAALVLTPEPISLLGIPVKKLTLPLVLPTTAPKCSK
jgi:hypothetical protein